MSEGGCYAWKRQTITGNPACDYSNLSKPLPKLPKGHVWVRNSETREWSVVDTTKTSCEDFGLGLTAETKTNLHVAVGVPVEIESSSDYLYHSIQPTDTFPGICLRYGIDALSLRQANNKFSGSNLLFAPETLLIPIARKALGNSNENTGGLQGSVRRSTVGKEDKVTKFLLSFRNKASSSTSISRKEAIAYLDMNDGNLEMAIQDAKDDLGWEQGEGETSTLL
jgi:hypothetical protein